MIERRRRSADNLAIPMFIAGVAFALMGIILEALHLISDRVFYVILILAAGCLPTHRFVEAFRIWRRNGDSHA